MRLNPKSLEKLRILINEETKYRSGPELVKFFNGFGFNDTYGWGGGFPSRWVYTDEKLTKINGTPELDKCIRAIFNPAEFIGQTPKLDKCIADLNAYLMFDKWKVIRVGVDIEFKKLDKIEIDEPSSQATSTESDFLTREFSDVPISKVGLEAALSEVLAHRLKEIEQCFKAGAHLSVILMAGSTLEGVFLGLASKHPRQFNSSKSSPKDSSGKVLSFHLWSLSAYIDAAKDLGLIQHDTHKFSHSLRDFRNYIHPYEQLVSGFSPRENTAKICLQVLKAAVNEISESLYKL